jgi:hypothetical protein
MAYSGTKTFELDVAEYIEEAFERCGIEVRTGYDQRTARRSLNLLLAEWANRGLNQWTIKQQSVTMTVGVNEYPLEAYDIDVLDAVCRFAQGVGTQNQQDLTVDRISREVYLDIPAKLRQARPVQYFVDRQITPVIKVWPTPDQTYYLIINKLVRLDDVNSSTNTLQLPFRFYPCLAAGLAYYLSLKKAPERTQMLKGIYEEEFDKAAAEDRDRASLMLTPMRNFYGVV